jgi:hypothetical protein
VLTSEPEDRLFKKLSNASCAVETSSELSADPILLSRFLKVVALLELFDVLDVLAVEAESSVESNKLVSES